MYDTVAFCRAGFAEQRQHADAVLTGTVRQGLADDLGETKNLATSQPGRVKKMKALLEEIITRGRSTPGKTRKNDVKVRRYGGQK